MAYTFTGFKERTGGVCEWLTKELSSVHTGRASIGLLDSVRAEVYGSQMPLQQLAGLTLEDARTIRISPWATDSLQAIDRALREANLGISVSADDKGIRVIFPDLTTETREKYVKVVGKKLEEGRISVRAIRDEVWNDIQKKEKDGTLSEDEKFAAKDAMEAMVKEANEKLEAIAKRKEEEVMGK